MKIVLTRAQSASSLGRPRVDVKSAPVKSASLKPDTLLLSASKADWSRPQSESSASRPRAGHGRVAAWSLSEAAREENSRKELLSYQLDNVRSHPSSPATHCIAEINDDPEVGVEKPEVFLKNASELDDAIEAMTRRVRLDHLMGSLESTESMRLQQIREEARKRKEAEIRKARKKAQESSNPNTKVEARMSLARMSTAPDLSASSKKGSVPMQTLSVDRAGGRVERVTVVDIKMLQQSCLCLDNNRDVHAILEIQKRREQQGPHSSLCSVQRSNSAPVRGLRGLTSQDWQEKHALVYSKGQKMQAQLTLQRVSNMRNQWKFDLPFVIDRDILADSFTPKVKEPPAAAGDDSPFFPKDETLECCPSGSRPGARRRESLSKHLPVNVLFSRQLPFPGSEEADGSSSPSRRRVSVTGAISPDASPARRNVTGPMSRSPKSTGGSSLKRRMTIATVCPTKSAASIRARKLWSYTASALVKVLMLLFRVRKHHRSMAVIQFFLKQFGEWARMRRSITQLRNSTKVLQRTFRSFHASKKHRCAAMEKEWIRVEDHLLSIYFTNMARKLMSPDDSKGQQGRKPQRASKSKSDQRTGEAPEVMIDWKVFRIPQRERKAIISVFFMLGLRKRTRMQENFYHLTVEALSSQRDLQRYLNSFGCTSEEEARLKSEEHDDSPEATKDPSTEIKAIPFYVLCEDTAHFMIHQAAQALVNVDPFQEHPHNKDNPNKKIRPPGSVMVFAAAEDSDGKIAAAVHPHSIAELALHHQERRMFRKPEKNQRPSSSKERHTSKSKQDTVSQVSKSSHRARHRDVEEVLGNFVFHSERMDELSEDEDHSHALSAAS